MKALIIPDSFKGSLTASQVANQMAKAVKIVFPNASCTITPFSDGGEGAIEVLKNEAEGKIIDCYSTDSLKRSLTAPYFLFEDSQSAWIELSQTAGLIQLEEHEKNPLKTSTWGTGIMILHALNQGCKTIYLGIGGSATHDLGAGIISALGGRFYDQKNKILEPIGANLSKIERIDLRNLDPRVKNVNWVIACDVQNIITGPKGAAHTYAKQKGGTKKIIEELEIGSNNFARVVKKQFDKNILNLPGGGAAGGVSAGLFSLFNAKIEKGFELLAQRINLEEQIKKMDIVLTGEGHFDEQSTFGKLPLKVAELSCRYKIKTFLFAGKTSIENLPDLPCLKIYQTSPATVNLLDAMKNASHNLESKVIEVLLRFKKQI